MAAQSLQEIPQWIDGSLGKDREPLCQNVTIVWCWMSEVSETLMHGAIKG